MYFLNIIKPKGITSFGLIRKLRKRLNIKQIGHSGTLDPLASGVMQVGVGCATKLLDYLNSDKEYIADICLGYESTTYDDEGEKIFIKKPEVSISILHNALNSFLGESMQIPPKYSAIKFNGKKLCDIARKYQDIDIASFSRKIEIYAIEILDFNNFDKVKIKVNCKKGTYIRSLAHDLGMKLGCGAYLSDLMRTKAGNFLYESANNLDDEKYNLINPLDVLMFHKYELEDDEFKKIVNGNFISPRQAINFDKILLTNNNKLVSFAVLSDNLIKPKKIFKDSCK